MPEEKKTDTSKVEEQEDEKDTETEDAEETEVADADEEEEESDSKDADIDYDAEIEKEKKRGKPDLDKASQAFKDREAKRIAKEAADAEEEDEDEKPLTRKDLNSVRAEVRQELQEERALEFAKSLSGSDREAELVLARWKNRSYPQDIPLSEQIEEVFAGVHKKKLIGERNEALRALKAKSGVSHDASAAQREGNQSVSKPKISSADMAGMKAAGFEWNASAKRLEKKLSNGTILVRDPKTNRAYPLSR